MRENKKMDGLRVDKWLWAARFFKTRALASKACELGRVQANGQPIKAAREVHVGEFLQIRTEGGDFRIQLLGLSDMRGPAPIAQALYRETDESRDLRVKVAAERKASAAPFDFAGAGRPSKRDRRLIHRFRGD